MKEFHLSLDMCYIPWYSR